MRRIKFSHRYHKMPADMSDTVIQDVAVIDYKDLTPEQIEKDTAIVGGGYYQLPKMKLIVIMLRSRWKMAGGSTARADWTTMRPYNKNKFDYYAGLIGEKVEIVIN